MFKWQVKKNGIQWVIPGLPTSEECGHRAPNQARVAEYEKTVFEQESEDTGALGGNHSSSGVRKGPRDQEQGEQPEDGDDLRSEITGPGSLENSQEESKIMLTTITAIANTHSTHFR